MIKLLIEAILVGILTIFIFYIVNIILEYCNIKSIILITFLTGFTIHIICQFTGVNKWYCKNGLACVSEKPNNFEDIHPASI